jgi:hypothetical protein
MSGKADALQEEISRFDVNLKGIYGEGSKSAGFIFQVSNRKTLGMSENEILENLEQVTAQIVDIERRLRREVLKNIGSKEVSIKDISDVLCFTNFDEEKYRDGSVLKDAPQLLREIACTKRFGEIKVREYISLNDTERTLQFAAMEFVLPDDTSYVAYRGTDDTLVGWKEDFMLALHETEAEKEAADYLDSIAAKSSRTLRIGGHSKGGHLAVYAAANCSSKVLNRITGIYSNDGPGFTDSAISGGDIQKIIPKIISIIPEESIVGLLMMPVKNPIVVKSRAKSVHQHNPATWCIEGKELVRARKVSKVSLMLDKLIKENVSKMAPEQLDEFVEDLFSVFESTGASTFSEIKKGGLTSLKLMARSVGQGILEKELSQ